MAIALTERGRMLLGGPADPDLNPVRYRKCITCGRQVDLMEDALWWHSDNDTFEHKQCDEVEDG